MPPHLWPAPSTQALQDWPSFGPQICRTGVSISRFAQLVYFCHLQQPPASLAMGLLECVRAHGSCRPQEGCICAFCALVLAGN